ncbi:MULTISPECIES: ABC transporter ATP-binding protein [Agrobacterium tumefaciens complex]|uniref:iron ABC transporter ATP-binding protein n=1 Tax=Agrobacterium tumefaciens complex TaxID=1183400 RepID=UPI000DD7A03A|nr:ABC transporter ATP-binding protein [Agrobacterium tumefaciens]MDR6589998.1 iron complex transport system ATP-binding protein [Agrobacterium tumefaciens]UNZ49807.1 ABC transporter ATP-binding protein [Agrobacterium tumefaciens]
MIIASQISKSYGDTVVIDGVSVSIPAGGVTSIIGPNGAGKSTLLSIVARLMSMDAGTVTVDGLDVTKTASDTLAKRLSILRQDNHISSRLTVRDLVGFGRYPYSKGRPTIEDKVHIDRALEYLHLQPLAGRFLDELSGGQRQRAFVAMVLCQDTDYVLLDEPLNNLDMKHASSMMKIMRKAADELKKTVVLVLHDINFASWYSDTIIAMREGRICHHGPAEEIIRPEILQEIYDMPIRVNEIEGRRICLFYE